MGRLFSCFRGPAKRAAAAAETADEAAEEQRRAGPVLVELFSSQGCRASPEAELLLGRLGRGELALEVPVVVLGFHVDVWDYLGWRDPFGSSLWTVRQKAYVEALGLDTLFTPFAVVHGRAHCLGTDEEALLAAIRAAPRLASPTMQATFQRPSDTSLQISLAGPLRTKIDGGGADVMVALYENGLVTDCRKGENKGRVQSNDFVVRRMEKLCTVKDISAKKTVTGAVTVVLWEGFNPGKCGLAVVVQSRSSQTLGVQHLPLPEDIRGLK